MQKFPPANAHVHNLADQVLLGLELLPVEDPAPALPLLTSSAERETGTPGSEIRWFGNYRSTGKTFPTTTWGGQTVVRKASHDLVQVQASHRLVQVPT